MQNPWITFRYLLERIIIRGAFFRMLIMAGIIILIAVLAGTAVWAIGGIAAYDEAVWWAFLRLTDPGYLGDDEGVGKRIISTIVTVSGYVFFMGALIAVMTQWFHRIMAKIDSGTTPISMDHHFIVLGWTNRTEAIVRELLVSEGRVQRFYERLGRRPSLRVVVLADKDAATVRGDLEDFLEEHWSPDRIIVRVGTALRSEHLERIDYLNAAAIILPANTTLNESTNIDAATIKTLLSTASAVRNSLSEDARGPLLVAELQDDRKVSLARRAYPGRFESLATDRIIARTLAQNIRHRGLSSIYGEMLGHAFGNELYVREWRGEPVAFGRFVNAFSHASVIGFVAVKKGEETIRLNPEVDEMVTEGDRIIMIATSFEATNPGAAEITDELRVYEESKPSIDATAVRRVLILGWNEKVALLLEELDDYEHEKFEVTSVSLTTATERRREIRTRAGHVDIELDIVEADYTSATELERIQLDAFDNILLVASDWLDSDELADARTLMGYLAIQERLEECDRAPDVIVELLDPDNENLITRQSDIIVTTLLVSHMLTHLALRRELGLVFEELFGPRGVDIFFVSIERYELEAGDFTFGELRRIVAETDDLAIGVKVAGETILNPGRDETISLSVEDELVVLTNL